MQPFLCVIKYIYVKAYAGLIVTNIRAGEVIDNRHVVDSILIYYAYACFCYGSAIHHNSMLLVILPFGYSVVAGHSVRSLLKNIGVDAILFPDGMIKFASICAMLCRLVCESLHVAVAYGDRETLAPAVIAVSRPDLVFHVAALFIGVDLLGRASECPRLVGASVPVLNGDVGAVCCCAARNVQCTVTGRVQEDKFVIFGELQLP